MKKRDFLGLVLGSLGVPQLATGTSLYGTPVSLVRRPLNALNAPLRLSLAESNIPSELWNSLSSLGSLWERILTDPDEKHLFQRDPAGYLESRGVPRSILNARDQEVTMLLAVCDENVLRSSIRGDYKEFLGQLAALGVVKTGPPSALKARAIEVLRHDTTKFTENTKLFSGGMDSSRFKALLGTNEIQYIYSQIAPSVDQVAIAAVPVAIAAIIVAYVSIVTTVTVAILAGVYISVAVASAIVASAGCALDNEGQWPLFAGPPAGPITASTRQNAREAQADREFVERMLLTKRMMAMDPLALAEAQKTARIARLLKQDKFVMEANRQLIRDEIDAFIGAAEEMRLIAIPEATRTHVLDAMKNLSIRSAGLQ